MRLKLLGLALLATAAPALAQEASVSLRLDGKDVALPAAAAERVAARARDLLRSCGPNTALHPGNFGAGLGQTETRWRQTLDTSRLSVAFAPPLETRSHLGGALPAREAVIGLGQGELFLGPYFTRAGAAPVEHLQCDYLAALELACLADLAPFLPARYRETCATLERDAQGRILMPPADVAPSCS